MSFWGVVVAGTFGSWLGSAITYAVARIVGRPVIMRWGKFFFMPPNKVEKAEVFLQRYEVSGVFFARLLPVIRHLISIPAGLVRMGFGVFSLVIRARRVCLVHGARLVRPPHRGTASGTAQVPGGADFHRQERKPSPYSGRAGAGRVCYILMLRLTDRKKPEDAAADAPAEKEQ